MYPLDHTEAINKNPLNFQTLSLFCNYFLYDKPTIDYKYNFLNKKSKLIKFSKGSTYFDTFFFRSPRLGSSKLQNLNTRKSMLSGNRRFLNLKSKIKYPYKKALESDLEYNKSSALNSLKKNIGLSKFEILSNFYFKPIFFKSFFLLESPSFKFFDKRSIISQSLNYVKDVFIHSAYSLIFFSNLIPHTNFNLVFRKKMIKLFDYSKFAVTTIM